MNPQKQLYKTAITKFALVSPSDSIDLGLVLLGNLNMDTALQNSHHKIRDGLPLKAKKRKISTAAALELQIVQKYLLVSVVLNHNRVGLAHQVRRRLGPIGMGGE